MEQHGLNEAIALYQASIRQSPALMMESIPVDSNRGVTSRGNSPYDKFASPETRAKVLESRMQEISAFAQSRSIPASTLYALAEAAMRTGKIPDLGQFGLAGDDAVATKQFMLSNVLNLAGLEWTDYKGDPVVEEGREEREAEERAEEVARQANARKREARRRAQRMSAAYEESGLDPSRFMAESALDEATEREGMRKGTQVHTGEWGAPRGGRPGSGRINKVQMKIGKTKRRQAGKAAADAGMDEYETERRETQQDDVGFDPSRFMAEGSGGRKSLERNVEAAKKTHDKDVQKKARTVPGDYAAFEKATEGTCQKEREALKRQRQQLQQRPVGGHERMAHMVKRKEAYEKAGFPGTVKLPSQREPESRTGRPGGRQGWPINRAATRVQRGQEKLKQQQNSDVSFDASRYMAEGSTKAGGYPFERKEKHYQGHSDAELNYAHQDAVKAARASATHDPHAENWYRDDAATISKEMNRRRKGGSVTSSVDLDLNSYMSEEGGPYQTGGAPESANSSPAKLSAGGEPNPMNYEKRDLLPKKIMAELRKTCGDGIYGYSREELFRLARERGLLGTEEDVQVEHDYQGAAQRHGGKFVKYIQGNIGIYQFPSSGAAHGFAEDCSRKTTATPKVDGSMVFIDEPNLGEADGIVGASTDSTSAGSEFAPNPTQYGIEDELLKGRKKVKEDTRSETDKILGIVDGDPRGDIWPKLGSSMAALLNLEDCGIYRSPRGFQMEDKPERIEEMTTSGGMGGFIGGGMMGGMTGRTCAMPSYDDSYELPDDPEKRIEVLKKMLGKHGLKKPVEEDEQVEEIYEPAPNSTEIPVVRTPDYDAHPSRFMKRR